MALAFNVSIVLKDINDFKEFANTSISHCAYDKISTICILGIEHYIEDGNLALV